MEIMDEPEEMHYEGMCIRPPSEAYSILLQVTLGCSHNKCSFCGTYKDKRFTIKDDDIILNDIRFAAKYMKRQDRLFLMDGDALIIPQKRLMWILDRIREYLPWVKRVGAYGNAKGIGMKTPEQLRELKNNGLGILYMGVETGDEALLKHICKGASAQKLIDMGRKVREAGIKLSVTVLLGIGGKEKSLEHARATGKLLSAMDPNYVGALTVMIIPGTRLHEEFENGDFELPSEKGMLLELREMIEIHEPQPRTLFLKPRLQLSAHKSKTAKGKQDALDQIDRALRGEVGLRQEWMRAL